MIQKRADFFIKLLLRRRKMACFYFIIIMTNFLFDPKVGLWWNNHSETNYFFLLEILRCVRISNGK